MVESELIYKKITDLINTDQSKSDKVLSIRVAKGCLSKAIGQKKKNKNKLVREYGYKEVKFTEDANLSGYELMIEEERKSECI